MVEGIKGQDSVSKVDTARVEKDSKVISIDLKQVGQVVVGETFNVTIGSKSVGKYFYTNYKQIACYRIALPAPSPYIEAFGGVPTVVNYSFKVV